MFEGMAEEGFYREPFFQHVGGGSREQNGTRLAPLTMPHRKFKALKVSVYESAELEYHK